MTKDRRVGQVILADAHYSLICVAAYSCLVELFRIEQSGLELRVCLYIGIILIESVLAVGIKLNARDTEMHTRRCKSPRIRMRSQTSR